MRALQREAAAWASAARVAASHVTGRWPVTGHTFRQRAVCVSCNLSDAALTRVADA